MQPTNHFTFEVRDCADGYFVAKVFSDGTFQQVSRYFFNEFLANILLFQCMTGIEVTILD